MKKTITLLFSFLLSIILVLAQDTPPEVPQAFNYTGIALDDKGKEISNKFISVEASILDENQIPIYTEEHGDILADSKGFFSIKVGYGSSSDDFSSIVWESGAKFLKVGIDPEGGFAYNYLTPVKLLSVPFAFHAESSSSFLGGDYNDLLNTPQNLSDFNNDVGYLTSFTEVDPIFDEHVVSEVTASDITNWNNAYGWGDHSAAGYIADNGVFKGRIQSDDDTYQHHIVGTLTLGADGSYGTDLVVNGAGRMKWLVTSDRAYFGDGLVLNDFKTYINWNKSGGRGETVFGNYREAGWAGGFDFYDEEFLIARLTGSGNFNIWGDFGKLSDRRKKTNIHPIQNGLEKILNLEGVNFKWKDRPEDNDEHIGLIAQEVKKVLPELVKYGDLTDGGKQLYSISYEGIIPVMIEAIKEQYKIIEELKKEIERLK